MIDKFQVEFYKHELRSGVILNPFWLIDKLVIKDADTCTTVKLKYRYKEFAPACEKAAEMFLDCTDYIVNTTTETIRNGSLLLLTALYECIATDFPSNERNAYSVSSLLSCTHNEDNDNKESAVSIYMEELKEKYSEHPAPEHFAMFLEHTEWRQIIESMKLRFRPLYSFSYCEKDKCIYEYCNEQELIELAVSILHNCSSDIIEPAELFKKKDEIAFLSAILYFVMFANSKEYQIRRVLSHRLLNPNFFDAEINVFTNCEKISGLDKASVYWNKCRENILSGKYDKEFIETVANYIS